MDTTDTIAEVRDWLATNWTIVVPALIVTRYAFVKYNEPESNRFSTTGMRFWIWRFAYVVLLLGTTGFIALFLSIPALRSLLFPGQKKTDLPAALLAALLVIGSFKYRAIQVVDAKLRSTCHAFGYIPFGAVNLARSLTPSNFSLDRAHSRALEDYIDRKPWLDNSVLAFFPSATTEDGARRFARNMTIMAGIDWLSRIARYQPFFSKNSAAWAKINQDVEKYVTQTRTFFAAIASHQNGAQTEARAEELAKLRSEYQKRCYQIYEALVPFLSSAVHGSELTRGRVLARIRDIGFAIPRVETPAIPVNAVVAAVTLIAGILIVGGMLAVPLESEMQRHRFMFLDALTLCSFAAAILAALVIKRLNPWDPDLRDRPLTEYAATGVVALILCYIVNIAFMAVGHRLAAAKFSFFPPLMNMSVIAVCLGVIISFACDNAAGAAAEMPSLRLKEGAAAAIVLPAAMFVVVRLLPFPPPPPGDPPVTIGQIIVFRLMLAGIGFAAGAFIPYHYRRLRRLGVAAETGASNEESASEPQLATG